MALDAVREIAAASAFHPATLELVADYDALWHNLDLRAHLFCRLATGVWHEGRASFRQVYDKPWAENREVLRAYDSLPDEVKAEVLAFYTLHVHELTHHLDFLITPYGANIHGKLFREYRTMQRFAPLLLAEAEPPPGRLVDWEPGEDASSDLREAWAELSGIIRTLEALGDGNVRPLARHVTPGWLGHSEPLSVFSSRLKFPRVTVRGFLHTIGVSGDPGWYLRPSTILETRAVARCLGVIMRLFGNGQRAREPLKLYLRTFYGRADLDPDYRSLLDLLASVYGVGSFHGLIANRPMLAVRNVLLLADTAGWYALQAPPPMQDGTATRSSPVVRLLYYLASLAIFYNQGERSFQDGVTLMEKMDAAPTAASVEAVPIRDILEYCAGFAGLLRKMNNEEIASPVFRAHFGHILGVQQRRLFDRLETGYASHVGMPEHGQHPATGLRTEQEADDLATDRQAYATPQEVIDWFAFRRNFFYGHMPSKEAAAGLSRFFGGQRPSAAALRPG